MLYYTILHQLYLAVQLLVQLDSYVNQDRQALKPLDKLSVESRFYSYFACTYTCSAVVLDVALSCTCRLCWRP